MGIVKHFGLSTIYPVSTLQTWETGILLNPCPARIILTLGKLLSRAAYSSPLEDTFLIIIITNCLVIYKY